MSIDRKTTVEKANKIDTDMYAVISAEEYEKISKENNNLLNLKLDESVIEQNIFLKSGVGVLIEKNGDNSLKTIEIFKDNTNKTIIINNKEVANDLIKILKSIKKHRLI